MTLTPSLPESSPSPGETFVPRRHFTPQLIVGLFLMVAGLLMTVDRLGLIELAGVLRLWPALVVVLGLSMLVQRPDSHGRFWGTLWIFVGGWLLLRTLGIVRIGFGEIFWPLLLVFIGVRLITRTAWPGMPRGPRRRRHSRRWPYPDGPDGPPSAAGATATEGQGAPRSAFTSTGGSGLFAVLGESKRISNDRPFRGEQMTAFMGGCQLDLRQAVIPPGEEAVIEVFSIMGGLEVWVPSGWTVVSQIVPVMGAVDDKRLPAVPTQAPSTDPPPRLMLRGVVIMSGLTVKN